MPSLTLISRDTSEQSKSSFQKQMRAYERLLQGVAAVTNCLLTTQNYYDSIDQALAILGRATRADRIYIFKTHPHPVTKAPAMSQRWEWVAKGVAPELKNPELQNLMYRDAFPRWYEKLSTSEPVVGLVETFPQSERDILSPQGILSILVVPICIQEHFWGFVGFDQCKEQHEWTEVEVSTLWAIAGSFGGAIARHKAETAVQDLNSTLEQRIGERTHELKKANTELFSTLQQLQQTQSQLIHTEKMSSLGQMVAGIAHEINNPANFIQGNLAPAQRYVSDLMEVIDAYRENCSIEPDQLNSNLEHIDLDFLREDFATLMDSIRTGSHRITTIVQSLRSFSRLDESERKTVDVHHGIDSALSLLQHRINPDTSESIIEVVKNYDPQTPMVECYPGALNQVFMTLLTNAIDAIEQRHKEHKPLSASDKIEIQTVKQIDNSFAIRISDNGVGISEHILSKIFDPFFTTKPVGTGTGLGLSIAYQIVVQQHSGLLQCRSQRDQGTTFTIELPLSQTVR